MKNIILKTLLILFIGTQGIASPIDTTISKSKINKESLSISVKNTKTGKTEYKLNDKRPISPASTLKIITLSASLDTLGKDYEFSTKLYKNDNNELFLQLGADPFFTSSNLNSLISTAYKNNIKEPKKLYIDDTIIDSNEWGEGWQWDDDLSPYMPRFSAYNIDKNMLQVTISPTEINAPAQIHLTKFYPSTFMNLITTGDRTEIVFSRNNNISPDVINAEGIINKQVVKLIPVNHPKRYFMFRLEDALKNAKVIYYEKPEFKKLPHNNIVLIDEIKHPVSTAIEEVLKESNNFVAESIFKIAGAKYAKESGSLENSQKMLNSYFKKYNINSEDIKIVDGSGVSKNNLITADFMTEFLTKSPTTELLKNELPTSGEGTLTNRMLYFKDNLRAKTGTLSDISSLAGYITSKSGNTYAFDIIINDSKSKNSEKKSLEEHILRTIYEKY